MVPSNKSNNRRATSSSDDLWSKRFQWLPAEVKFGGDKGADVRITSYINNLQPDLYPNLYTVIEKFVSRAVPLWNQVLMPWSDDDRVPLRLKV